MFEPLGALRATCYAEDGSARQPIRCCLESVVVFVPAEGQYTIGVFRISWVEPEAVEPTVFQVQGRLVTAE